MIHNDNRHFQRDTWLLFMRCGYINDGADNISMKITLRNSMGLGLSNSISELLSWYELYNWPTFTQ